MSKSCRQCASPNVLQVLSLERMPLAGGFLDGPQGFKDEPLLPITVLACDTCGLVQIEEQIDPDVLFRQYSFSTSTVPALVLHFQDYARYLAHERGAGRVLEFGCNDGALLETLKGMGVGVIGVDAALNISEIARKKGLDVIPGYFTAQLAPEILGRIGRVDVVTGSNCFAHNADPGAILEAARAVLAPDGVFIAEVMSALDLLDKLQWDTLYHEHLAVYSLGSIRWMFRRFGWEVVDVFHLPMHAGSLRVVASPRRDAPVSPRVVAMLAEEERRGVNRAAAWQEWGTKVERQIAMVGDVLRGVASRGRVWAYGASGRATMWMNACGMDYVEAVVDSSPLRAGKLMPGLHQPIVFPEAMRADPPEYTLITAWNYADGIRAKEDGYKGVWITPLPTLEFL